LKQLYIRTVKLTLTFGDRGC